MSSDFPSSKINRRVLISGMALLPVVSGMPLTGIAQAQTIQGGSLASWNDGPAKQAIIDFVRATAEQGSPKFVPPQERIATFDQDGTCGLNTRYIRRSFIAWTACLQWSRKIRNSKTSNLSRRSSRANVGQSPSSRCMSSRKFSSRH